MQAELCSWSFVDLLKVPLWQDQDWAYLPKSWWRFTITLERLQFGHACSFSLEGSCLDPGCKHEHSHFIQWKAVLAAVSPERCKIDTYLRRCISSIVPHQCTCGSR